MRSLVVLLFIVLADQFGLAQSADFKLIRDTGTLKDNLPVMEIVPDNSELWQYTVRAINTSFMRESIHLFHFAQNFLINNGSLTERHPAYLGITRNQGGFARKGFFLVENRDTIPKTEAYYVDLTENNFRGDLGKLMSVTQLYPHELGHAIYRLLSTKDTLEQQSHATSIHYFSLLTEYPVAFNEGFAEHIENVSRLYELNDSIKAGIQKDSKRKGAFCARSANAFIRDFTWPLRLDLFKVTMIVWYQQYEDVKRYEHAMHDNATYLTQSPTLNNAEDMITIRNTGIRQLDRKRNKVQLMASEGFVSTFFTHLAMSNLPEQYREESFYKQFIEDTLTAQGDLRQQFSPIQNQFLKYFYIFHKYVHVGHSDRAQLIDFIDGYITEFPEERDDLLAIYESLAGVAYDNKLPPQLWYMVKNHPHRTLLLDAFSALTIPVYTFDINMAEVEDLLTMDGISRDDAGQIVSYRNEHGLFESFDDIQNIPGISDAVKARLHNSEFDQKYFENLSDVKLSITPLITVPLYHLLERSLLYFMVIITVMYTLKLRHVSKSIGNTLITFLKYYAYWITFLLAGLAAVVIQGNRFGIFSFYAAIFTLIGVVVLRKKRESLLRFLMVVFLMTVLMAYSLV